MSYFDIKIKNSRIQIGHTNNDTERQNVQNTVLITLTFISANPVTLASHVQFFVISKYNAIEFVA